MTLDEGPRLPGPTGRCWCGCGQETGAGAYFRPGHDKTAEAAVLATRYGNSVVRLLAHHGFSPEASVVAEATDRGIWEACPACEYRGAPASVTVHRRKAKH
ncbi:hypothetical protein ACWEL8_01760 [Streptomyces sp. NPDC004690]|uniref:hypothetical protein n=1 Tax=Streptomyces sp. NPDC007070 TaxID=3154312 RepID=UPI0033F9C182